MGDRGIMGFRNWEIWALRHWGIGGFILPLRSEDQVKFEKFNSDVSNYFFLFLVSAFQKCIALALAKNEKQKFYSKTQIENA